MKLNVILILFTLLAISSGCVSSQDTLYDSYNRSELIQESESISEDIGYGAIKRSPKVFEGRLVYMRMNVKDYKKDSSSYVLDIFPRNVLAPRFIGRIGASQLENPSVLNETKTIDGAEEKKTLHGWGVYQGLEEIRLEDESYATLHSIRFVEIDKEKHNYLKFKLKSTAADEICFESECIEEQNASYKIEEEGTYTYSAKREGYQKKKKNFTYEGESDVYRSRFGLWYRENPTDSDPLFQR